MLEFDFIIITDIFKKIFKQKDIPEALRKLNDNELFFALTVVNSAILEKVVANARELNSDIDQAIEGYKQFSKAIKEILSWLDIIHPLKNVEQNAENNSRIASVYKLMHHFIETADSQERLFDYIFMILKLLIQKDYRTINYAQTYELVTSELFKMYSK